MNSNTQEINDIKSIIRMIKDDPSQTEKIKKQVQERGLEQELGKFEQTYGAQINEFMQSLAQKGDMSDEEKAMMIMNMKKKLPPENRKQISEIIAAMKNYIRNN